MKVRRPDMRNMKKVYQRGIMWSCGYASYWRMRTNKTQEMERIPKLKLNSVALVRERTIQTERPLFVCQVSAKFLRIKGATW
jgi:hypothetical protein